MVGGVPGVPGLVAQNHVTLVSEVGQENAMIHQQRMEGNTALARAATILQPATKLLAL